MRGVTAILLHLPFGDVSDVEKYIDDILVHSETWEDHLVTLREVLSRKEKAGITAHPTKRVFGAIQVDFVGHQLGDGSVSLQDSRPTVGPRCHGDGQPSRRVVYQQDEVGILIVECGNSTTMCRRFWTLVAQRLRKQYIPF